MLVALTAIAAVGTPDAAAEIGAVHPDLVRAEAAVRAAKGPEIYAALREVWRMWDRAGLLEGYRGFDVRPRRHAREGRETHQT